jgi:hypothetical protein
MNGIFVFGTVTMLQAADDPVPEVSVEPVYLSPEFIDNGIGTGTLTAGQFNNVKVMPPVEAWPPAWRFLKEQ